MASKQKTVKSVIDKYFDNEGNFDVNKASDEILSIYNIIFVPKQGHFMFNAKFWINVEKNYIAQLITAEMKEYSKPFYTKQIIEHIEHKKYIELRYINSNRNRLILNNGTLDLSDWKDIKFYENKYFPEDYSTIHYDWSYDPSAKCPEFMKYLDSTFKGFEENINIVQEMFGYCLTTSVRFEKIFIFYGEGSTGKSVLIDTLKTLIGEANYGTVPMSLLSKSFLRASLKDKVINISTEENNSMIKDTAWIKVISSGDPTEAQFKCKDTFNFNPFCKLVYAMNDLPQIENFDKALRRRFLIIPFNNIFQGKDIDLSLKDGKLHTEMEGIMQFALEGLKRLAEQEEFSHSNSSLEQLENYSMDSNHAERFADTYLIDGDIDNFLITNEIYKLYCDFCKIQNDKPFKSSEFCRIIKRKFGLPEKRKQKKINNQVEDIFEGLKFKDCTNESENVRPTSLELTEKMAKNKNKILKFGNKSNIA